MNFFSTEKNRFAFPRSHQSRAPASGGAGLAGRQTCWGGRAASCQEAGNLLTGLSSLCRQIPAFVWVWMGVIAPSLASSPSSYLPTAVSSFNVKGNKPRLSIGQQLFINYCENTWISAGQYIKKNNDSSAEEMVLCSLWTDWVTVFTAKHLRFYRFECSCDVCFFSGIEAGTLITVISTVVHHRWEEYIYLFTKRATPKDIVCLTTHKTTTNMTIIQNWGEFLACRHQLKIVCFAKWNMMLT